MTSRLICNPGKPDPRRPPGKALWSFSYMLTDDFHCRRVAELAVTFPLLVIVNLFPGRILREVFVGGGVLSDIKRFITGETWLDQQQPGVRLPRAAHVLDARERRVLGSRTALLAVSLEVLDRADIRDTDPVQDMLWRTGRGRHRGDAQVGRRRSCGSGLPLELDAEVNPDRTLQVGEVREAIVQILAGIHANDERNPAADQFIDSAVVLFAAVSKIPEFTRRTVEPRAPFRKEQLL